MVQSDPAWQKIHHRRQRPSGMPSPYSWLRGRLLIKATFPWKTICLLLVMFLIVVAPAPRAEEKEDTWDQAGREVTEAAGAVGDATVQTSREVWQKAEGLWHTTRRASDATWESVSQEAGQVWEKAIQEAGAVLNEGKALLQGGAAPDDEDRDPPAK